MIAEKDTGDVLILYVMNSTFYKLKKTHAHTHAQERDREEYISTTTIVEHFFSISLTFNTPFNSRRT